MANIKIQRATQLKEKPKDQNNLGFGDIFTDHMFVMNYDEGEGWHSPRVVPYQNISLDPAAMVLHYGQEVFEGMKAYRRKDGGIYLFRPDQNFARLNSSNDRLCVPLIDEDLALEGQALWTRGQVFWIQTMLVIIIVFLVAFGRLHGMASVKQIWVWRIWT